jgi:hypothetical protein
MWAAQGEDGAGHEFVAWDRWRGSADRYFLAVVEHYRNLWNFVRIVHEKEDDGSTICNPTTCPKMSAGK